MSQHSTPPLRNPAPHRGFNAKAREILLDSPKVCSGMRRSGSDEEFLRRVGLIRFRRAGSEESASGGSTPASMKGGIGFNGLDDNPKIRSMNRKSLKCGHRLLADIGKTRSVGDLTKRIARASLPMVRPFQQLNIANLPGQQCSQFVEEGTLRSSNEGEGHQSRDSSKRRAQYKCNDTEQLVER